MILLTGSTGLVGGHLLRRLVAAGGSIRCLVREPASFERLKGLPVELCSGDLVDLASLQRAIEGVDQVIHLAGILQERGEATFKRVNAEGTQNLVQAAQEAGVHRFVYLSCLWASPDPASPFAFSKWKGEEAVRESGLPFTILRPSVVFGEGDRFIHALVAFLRRTPIVPIARSGCQVQPIWAADVASCILRSLAGEKLIGRTFPIGGPERLTYQQVVELVLKTLGLKRLKLSLSASFLRLLPKPPLPEGVLEHLKRDAPSDPDVVRRTFGFHPMPLAEGLGYLVNRRRVEWREAPKDASRHAR